MLPNLLTFILATLLALVPARVDGPRTDGGARLERITFHPSSRLPGTVVRLHFSARVEHFAFERNDQSHAVRLTAQSARVANGLSCAPVTAFASCKIEPGTSHVVVEIVGTAPLLKAEAYRDSGVSTDLLIYLHVSDAAPLAALDTPSTVAGPTPGGIARETSIGFDSSRAELASGESPAPPPERPGSPTLPVRPASTTETQKLRIDTIVLDAGHGGKDPGTIGHERMREKDLVLDIAKRVGAYLEAAGFKVAYTRDDDTFILLKDRGRLARDAGGKMFVSIHANSARDHRAQGTETFFLGTHKSDAARDVIERENQVIDLEEDRSHYEQFNAAQLARLRLTQSANLRQSQDLAGRIQEQYRDRAGRRDRKVKEGNLYVLWSAGMPAILTEVGFISNPEEARYLASEQGKAQVASAIFRAIRDYRDAYEASLDLATIQ